MGSGSRLNYLRLVDAAQAAAWDMQAEPEAGLVRQRGYSSQGHSRQVLRVRLGQLAADPGTLVELGREMEAELRWLAEWGSQEVALSRAVLGSWVTRRLDASRCSGEVEERCRAGGWTAGQIASTGYCVLIEVESRSRGLRCV